MSPSGPVMVVGHDASRSGAPLLLASSLRWACRHASDELSLVLDRGGPLEEEYRSLVPVRVLDGPVRRVLDRATSALDGLVPRVAATDAVRRWEVTGVRDGGRAGTVVANTLAALPTATALVADSSRLVVHVHELDHVAQRVLPREAGHRRRLLERVDLFVAAGQPVRRMLEERMGIERGRIVVVDPFIDLPVVSDDEWTPTGSVADGGGLVVSIGATSHRKGTDRFVDLMAMLADHRSAPSGVWLGGDPDGTVAAEMRSDIARAGLVDRVHLLGHRDAVASVLAAAAVVVSTAREDPFPLGVLEAGAVDTPVVAFDAGGAAEVLRASGNPDLVVPLGDTIAMSDRVADLLTSPDLAARCGARLGAYVRANHLTSQLAPPLWTAILGAPLPGGTR